MEEGPEPQELLEQVEKTEHAVSHHEAEEKSKFNSQAALIASFLAVLASVGSLLSGHAANEAILKQAEASNQWSFYQAKSTKSHIFESNQEVLGGIAMLANVQDREKLLKDASHAKDQVAKYEREKAEIQAEATSLEKISTKSFAKHENFSLAVACFQIGIVLSSMSILSRIRLLQGLSLLVGVIGIVFIAVGF